MFIPILTQLEYLLRIVVAMLCGAAIGYERESRLKTAGIRTHLIVSTASALIMVISKYGFNDVIGINGIGLDPSRIGAGAITAIGFLGAGIIFVRKQNVSGITTSAGIWATVGVGTAIGAGLYLIGSVVSLLIILVQVILHRQTRLVHGVISAQVVLRVEDGGELERLFQEVFSARHIEILTIKATQLDNGGLEVKLFIKCPECYQSSDLVQLLQEVPSIRGIEV